jgi:hypothetical protein
VGALDGEYEGPVSEYEGVHVGAFKIMVLDENAEGCKYPTELYSNIYVVPKRFTLGPF